jgi:hypothetical protein
VWLNSGASKNGPQKRLNAAQVLRVRNNRGAGATINGTNGI